MDRHLAHRGDRGPRRRRELVQRWLRAVNSNIADTGDAGDEGTTLIELVVAMLIMTVFMGMFTSAVILMNRSENKAEALNYSSAQINQAFLALDKTVRYASVITAPGCVNSSGASGCGTGASGDWYVELLTTNTGTPVCTQLRVDVALTQLQKRTWNPTSLPTTAPAFTPVTSAITNGGAAIASSDQPFVLQAQTATGPVQQLTINLVSPSGSGSTQTTSRSSFTFSAMNSIASGASTSTCQEEGRP